MQIILQPSICVIDHINEIIITAQQAKIPLSEAGVNIEADLGGADPFHENESLNLKTGALHGILQKILSNK